MSEEKNNPENIRDKAKMWFCSLNGLLKIISGKELKLLLENEKYEERIIIPDYEYGLQKNGIWKRIGYYTNYIPKYKDYLKIEHEFKEQGECFCDYGYCPGRKSLPHIIIEDDDTVRLMHHECADASFKRFQNWKAHSFEATQERNFQKLASHWGSD